MEEHNLVNKNNLSIVKDAYIFVQQHYDRDKLASTEASDTLQSSRSPLKQENIEKKGDGKNEKGYDSDINQVDQILKQAKILEDFK